jgi:hypothetical protein
VNLGSGALEPWSDPFPDPAEEKGKTRGVWRPVTCFEGISRQMCGYFNPRVPTPSATPGRWEPEWLTHCNRNPCHAPSPTDTHPHRGHLRPTRPARPARPAIAAPLQGLARAAAWVRANRPSCHAFMATTRNASRWKAGMKPGCATPSPRGVGLHAFGGSYRIQHPPCAREPRQAAW